MAASTRRRRLRGTGSVYRTADGTYVGVIELPPGPGGKRRRKVVRSRDRRELLAKLEALRSRQAAGLPQVDNQTTVAACLAEWCEEILPGTVKASTVAHYRQMCRLWIVPHVGSVRLGALGPEHVNRMMHALEADGLSPRTITLARAILRRALGQAERWGKVSRNAAALVDRPRQPPRLDDALSADEAAKVLAAAEGDRLEALAAVVLTLGLRQGEVLALRWVDVDLEARRPHLRVVRSKTDAGIRTLALPVMAERALRAHKRAQAAERLATRYWVGAGLVFTNEAGGPLERRAVLRWWHGLCARAGVPRRRFHATRHTAATLMLNNGVPLEVVSATLGHAGLAITADIYARVGADYQRQAADAMDRVFGG